MKEKYIKPCMITEIFMPNQAVSTCHTQGDIEWKFDCMRGPNVDSAKVVATGIDVSTACTNKVGFASGISTAYDFFKGNSHSNNNPDRATWKDTNYQGNWCRTVTYKGAEGLLYADADGRGNFTTDNWSTTTVPGAVAHNSNQGKMHHMVAPVVDSRSVNASW